MNTTNGLIGQWSQWMLHAGWQAAVVAIAVIILLLLVRRRISSQLRYAVLCVALLKFAAPPFLIGAGAWFEAGVFSLGDWISVPPFNIESSNSGFVAADSTGPPQNRQLTESEAEENSAVIATSVNNKAASISHRQATSVAAVAASESIPRWLLLLAIVYLCGVIASVIAIARQLTRVRQFVGHACSAD